MQNHSRAQQKQQQKKERHQHTWIVMKIAGVLCNKKGEIIREKLLYFVHIKQHYQEHPYIYGVTRMEYRRVSSFVLLLVDYFFRQQRQRPRSSWREEKSRGFFPLVYFARPLFLSSRFFLSLKLKGSMSARSSSGFLSFYCGERPNPLFSPLFLLDE